MISKRGVEIPLERINNINFHQRMIDRIIGAGDLDIESAGKDGQSHFDFIRHPDGVQHEIYRQMESRNMPMAWCSRRPPWSRRAPTPAASVPEQIEQLARLRDQGHITDGRVRGEEGAAPRADVAHVPSASAARAVDGRSRRSPSASSPVAASVAQ